MAKQDKSKDGLSVNIIAAGAIASHAEVPKERAHFRALIVANPNYFGNLTKSPFPPVFAVNGNTTYERIKCVGFHPQLNRLDAVVFVNQSYGYGGSICSEGSTEYVRFYTSKDNGANWVDQGYSSFTAHDIPADVTGGKRLEYAVSIPCSPTRFGCAKSNILLARAILSWNSVPPPDTPDYSPVWGNVHDTNIQVDPTWILTWVDILKYGGLKLTPEFAAAIDLDEPVTLSPKKALGLMELHELYKGAGVEPHRFAMTHLKNLVKVPESTIGPVQSLYPALFDKLGYKLSDVLGQLLNTDGSTVYEELDCVGLRPNGMSDELVGVLRIKRPSGFSGGPCTQGSREYVTFWGDFNNNGTFETCLGTASVQVFDLDVPPKGLEYSVRLPVDLNPYRRNCGEGPRVVPIRAILSWNEVPNCGNPNWIPTWGNREETLILIPPGSQVTDDNPFLYDISGAAVCAIDQGTGLATGGRPFGGTLCITGEIPSALSVAVPNTLEYRLWATQGALVNPISASFSLTVEEGTGPGTSISYTIVQNAVAGFFTYREHGTPAIGAWRRVSSPNRILGYWSTVGLTGTWTIHIEARAAGTVAPVFAAGVTTCLADGTTRSSVNVTLDQLHPVADVDITGYTDASGPHAALPCGDFGVGVTINGTFDITDNMGVGSFSLALEPAGAVAFVLDAGSTATHVFGTWTVSTVGLEPCGYVVHLEAYDKTIANCNGGWRDDATVGFCLRRPIA